MAQPTNALPNTTGNPSRGSPGYFRIERCAADQWRFADPSGRPFFVRAVHGVAAVKGSAHDPAARLRLWGFNALGCDCGDLYGQDGLPYFATAGFGGVGLPVRLAGVRLPDVFDPDWPELVERRAREVCLPLADDTQVLGWLTDDSLSWASRPTRKRPGLLQVCLSLDPVHAAYHTAWEFAHALRGAGLERLAQGWGIDLKNKASLRELTLADRGLETCGYREDDAKWTREYARRYFGTTVAALRRFAPRHLVLGCRWEEAPVEALVRECEAVCDAAWVDEVDLASERQGPVILGQVNWADSFSRHLPSGRRGLGPGPLEQMLRKGRQSLARAIRHPAVIGYVWSHWHDRAGDVAPFGRGLVRRDDTEAWEHTEILTRINERVEDIRGLHQPPVS